MKRGIFLQLALAAVLLLPAWAGAQSANGSSLSLGQYREKLAAISQGVDSLREHPENAGSVEGAIPDTMTVTTSAGEIAVHHSELKSDIAEFAKADSKKRALLLPQIQDYVHRLSRDAADFDRPSQAPDARGKLTAILARREFRNLKGANAKDVLLSKIFGWLIRLLNRISMTAGGNFNWFQLLVYLIIGIALVVILVWTLRRLRGAREEPSQREIVPFSPSARSWHAWLAEARWLAQQQDWRNAIHLAYWAGISYLEEHGAWKPNRARTPREYLGLVGARTAKYPVLAALTRQLERVWYGYSAAGQSDFEETLTQLEKLGCR